MPALKYRATLPRPDDPNVYEPILEAIRNGHPQATAAAMAGIHEDTLYHWRYQGQEQLRSAQGQHIPWEELGSHARLVIRLKEAEAGLVDRALEGWWTGKVNDWARYATMLERRFPDHFGRQRDSAPTLNVTVNVQAQLDGGTLRFIAERALAQAQLNEGRGAIDAEVHELPPAT